MPDENSTISGFNPNGFDFNKLVGSVGDNLQTWALQSLNRQAGIDQGERGAIKAPSVVDNDGNWLTRTFNNFYGAYGSMGIAVVAAVIAGGFWLWKKKG